MEPHIDSLRGCAGLLSLIQAILKTGWPAFPRLWLITRGAQPAGHEMALMNPDQSALWGLARVIPLEHKDMRCTCVDLDPSGDAMDMPDLVNELWHPDREDQVALRRGVRYAARLVPYKNTGSRPPVEFHKDKTYLITGGLGALGLLAAKWMVSRGAANLALVGRRDISNQSGNPSVALSGQARGLWLRRRTYQTNRTWHGCWKRFASCRHLRDYPRGRYGLGLFFVPDGLGTP